MVDNTCSFFELLYVLELFLSIRVIQILYHLEYNAQSYSLNWVGFMRIVMLHKCINCYFICNTF